MKKYIVNYTETFSSSHVWYKSLLLITWSQQKLTRQQLPQPNVFRKDNS